MLRLISGLLMCVLLITGCGTDMEKYQGMTNRDDVENMGMNDSVTRDTENPRMINNVGDTWGRKQDRKLIKEAAAEVPRVTVNRVIIEASKVFVNVDIEGEDDMSSDDQEEWKEEIERSIYRAVPRYDIQVKIK